MSVHVGEVHSEVTPVGPFLPAEPSARESSPWAAEERWNMTEGRARWIAQRTAAECFSD